MDYLEHQAGWADITSGLEGAALVSAFRELCRRDLYFLLRVGCGRADFDRQWLYERCMEIQSDPDGHIDLWSRDHYKSTIITFGKTIQDILCSHGEGAVGRECVVGIFSYSRPLAKDFLKMIKREFESNERLREWFPDVLWENPAKQAPKWSDDEGIIVKRKSNPRESTVEAWGLVDSQPTGKHFTHLVYDDVVVQGSVTTPEMIQKTLEMLELSYNLGSQGQEKIRYIGTRYHFNDAFSTLIERGAGIPRIKPCTEDGTITGKPVLLTPEILADKYRRMGPYTFSCQMLLNPVADENQGFRREWLRFHDGFNEQALRVMNKYILVDPANAKKKGSDYTCLWVVGLGTDDNYYLIDMVRDRLNLAQRSRMVMEMHRKYQPMRNGGVRYEQYGMQSDIEHLKALQAGENYRFDITPMGGSTPKIDRIGRLMPLFEAGRIYIPRAKHYTQYDGKTVELSQVFVEEEYVCFPVPRHDDMLDCLARIVEPDHPVQWPRKGNVYTGSFGGVRLDTEYQIFG
jgi:predicted phage terminase large subunit-like protein